MSLLKALEFITKHVPDATSYYSVADIGDGLFIQNWNEEVLGERPTQTEIDEATTAAQNYVEPLTGSKFIGKIGFATYEKIIIGAKEDTKLEAFLAFVQSNGAVIDVYHPEIKASILYLSGREMGGVSIKHPVMTPEEAAALVGDSI